MEPCEIPREVDSWSTQIWQFPSTNTLHCLILLRVRAHYGAPGLSKSPNLVLPVRKEVCHL